MEVRETATISEKAASTAKSTGKMLVQFISPGWGSSGYYSPDVLQEAAAERVIPAGTHMYADHPTKKDRAERPERSIRDLMAVTTTDAQVSADGALVGEVRVLAPYQSLIEDLKDHIGVSVLGDAKDVYEGEAEGRPGKIIAGLAHINSVDFVTRAGRGGQVLSLLESAQAGTLSESSVTVLPDAWLLDGIHVELAEALREIATSPAGVQGTEKLHAYWRKHIKWDTAGDFDECVRHLSKYVADPKGYCAKMHKDVTGATPGHAAGESDPDERVITIMESGLGLDQDGHSYRLDEGRWAPVIPRERVITVLESGLGLDEEGHTYRYRHGWIPIGATANDKAVAKLSLHDRQVYAAQRSSGKSHEDAFAAVTTKSSANLKSGHTFTHDGKTYTAHNVTLGGLGYTHHGVQAEDEQGSHHNLAIHKSDTVQIHKSRYDEHGNVLPGDQQSGHYQPTPEQNGNQRQLDRAQKLLTDAEAAVKSIQAEMKRANPSQRANYQIALDNHKRTVKWAKAEIRKLNKK